MRDQTAPSGSALGRMLHGYSAEVTSGDRRSIEAAARLMQPGAEVFIASLPSDDARGQIRTAVTLKQAGLTPVPHVVARNLASLLQFDDLLARLTGEAGVDRILILGGDRTKPMGELHSSLQLLQSGLISKRGIRRIAIGTYPEGHPRIDSAELSKARREKLIAAQDAGLHVTLISQFCFDATPILAHAGELRTAGIEAPLRVGVAGPASRTALLKYAMLCGVGASMRALKERQAASRNLAAGETPENLLQALAEAQRATPSLGISGVHFFTFASLQASVDFVAKHRR